MQTTETVYTYAPIGNAHPPSRAHRRVRERPEVRSLFPGKWPRQPRKTRSHLFFEQDID